MRERDRTSFLAALALLISAAKLAVSQVAVSVTTVTTAQELKAALDLGARFVHITNHLDLTTLPPSSLNTLFDVGASLQSVTVRLCDCASLPLTQSLPNVALYPWQC
jgi:hypothetical protein